MVVTIAAFAACGDNDNENMEPGAGSGSGSGAVFQRVNLVSDLGSSQFGTNDPNMVNAWGIVAGVDGFWIANNGTGVMSVYDGAGNPLPENDKITLEQGITGIAFNTTNSFLMTANSATAPAIYIVASETGRIFGINPNLATAGFVMVDNSASNAVYKGTAIASINGVPELLVADFHNARIAVYDTNFAPVSFGTTMFQDPGLPAGYAPFNVAVAHGAVYVMYAMQDAVAHDEIDGAGLGIIDVYDPTAPSAFGTAADAFLVGNFGDGRFTAIDTNSGRELGQIADLNNAAIVVDGLWGTTFGAGAVGDSNRLYFASGPNSEANGLYGRIELAQ
jgi:hypothetical protein